MASSQINTFSTTNIASFGYVFDLGSTNSANILVLSLSTSGSVTHIYLNVVLCLCDVYDISPYIHMTLTI